MFSAYNRRIEMITAATRSDNPKLIKRILYFATGCFLLMAIVGIYLLNWGWYALVLIVALGGINMAWSWYAKRHDGKPTASKSNETLEIPIQAPQNDTGTSEPTDGSSVRIQQTATPVSAKEARKIKPYRIYREGGKTWYEVNLRKTYKDHFWSRARVYVTTRKVEVLHNEVTNPKLLKRVRYLPGEGTKTVHVCDRLHWVEHAPLQIVSSIIGILTILAYTAFFLILIDTPLYLSIATALLVIMMVTLAALFIREWLPWAYTALIVDDQRLHLTYSPPAWLVGNNNDARVELFQDVKTEDQLNGSKWIPALGNFLPTLKVAGYKIFKASTAGQGDQWIENGIKYVRHAETVKQIVNNIIDSYGRRDEDRHDEDMEFQRLHLEAAERAAKATEEMRDLIQVTQPRQSNSS